MMHGYPGQAPRQLPGPLPLSYDNGHAQSENRAGKAQGVPVISSDCSI